jgi:hypothetical protein
LPWFFHLDEESSWAITSTYGKEWSCYDGALRIYWPPRKLARRALENSFWTRDRLIEQAGSAAAAASRIRDQLRRQLLELSTYTFDEPIELVQIRNDAARSRFDQLSAAAAEKGTQAELAELYFEESARLERAVADLREENKGLRDQVSSLSQALHFLPSS